MDIKIITAVHKPYWMPQDRLYVPLHVVGRAGKQDIGFTGDNNGDNISEKNATFCELTGLYWAWKNMDADHASLVHYRRYFTRKEVLRNSDKKKAQILGRDEWEIILSVYPVVVADKRNYYIETNRSHYNHAHPATGLDVTEQIIRELYPEYVETFQLVMNRA